MSLSLKSVLGVLLAIALSVSLPTLASSPYPFEDQNYSAEDWEQNMKIFKRLQERGMDIEDIQKVADALQKKEIGTRDLQKAMQEMEMGFGPITPEDLIETAKLNSQVEKLFVGNDPLADFLVAHLEMTPTAAATAAIDMHGMGEFAGRAYARVLSGFRKRHPAGSKPVDALAELNQIVDDSKVLDAIEAERFGWSIDRVSNLEAMTTKQATKNYNQLSKPPVYEGTPTDLDLFLPKSMFEEHMLSAKMMKQVSHRIFPKLRRKSLGSEPEQFAYGFLDEMGVQPPVEADEEPEVEAPKIDLDDCCIKGGANATFHLHRIIKEIELDKDMEESRRYHNDLRSRIFEKGDIYQARPGVGERAIRGIEDMIEKVRRGFEGVPTSESLDGIIQNR